MSHGVVCKYHYRENFRVWLTSVTEWLFFREGVANCPCKCGSVSEIYTEEEVIIREVKRDGAIEAEMIYLEQEFWLENVCKQIQPPYMEEGNLVMDSVRKYGERADENAPSVTLDITHGSALVQYMQLQEQKSICDAQSRKLESSMKRLRGQIVSVMGSSCKAVCQRDGQDYIVTYNPVRRLDVSKDNLLRLQLNHPEIYDEYVTVSEHRRFYVKAKEATAA